jgi:hypothetical protein
MVAGNISNTSSRGKIMILDIIYRNGHLVKWGFKTTMTGFTS